MAISLDRKIYKKALFWIIIILQVSSDFFLVGFWKKSRRNPWKNSRTFCWKSPLIINQRYYWNNSQTKLWDFGMNSWRCFYNYSSRLNKSEMNYLKTSWSMPWKVFWRNPWKHLEHFLEEFSEDLLEESLTTCKGIFERIFGETLGKIPI